MKTLGKMITVGLLAAVLLLTCVMFGACGDPADDGNTPGPSDTTQTDDTDTTGGGDVVQYNEETAEVFRFEAEEAVITAPLALKCDAMSYQGNGHVVKAAGGFAAGHFMQADPSGSGTTEYGEAAYVGYMGAAVGDKITFEIESEVACVANIIFQGKSSLYMGTYDEDPTARQNGSMWKSDETPIYINGVKQSFEDTFFQQKVWAKNVELTGVTLQKGKNVIEIVAEKALSTMWWDSNDWFDGTPRSAFPDLDFISIDASVDSDNFTFSNRTLTNEINENGYYTNTVCSWVDGVDDPVGFGE